MQTIRCSSPPQKAAPCKRLALFLEFSPGHQGSTLTVISRLLYLFNLTQQSVDDIENLFRYKCTNLPITYLGLPLSYLKPERVVYQSLIDKLKDKLPSWKSSLISRAGRITLAAEVLSSIPIYFMSVLPLPSWVIREIDKIRRNFIWGDTQGHGKKLHLMAWDRICLPKQVGGLGLSNLKVQNTALLVKWLWRLYSAPDSLWALIAGSLFSKKDRNVPPLLWNSDGSFFWKEVQRLRFHFQLATVADFKNGASTSLWYDCWSGNRFALLLPSAPKPPKHNLSLANAAANWHSYFPAPLTRDLDEVWSSLRSISLTNSPDRLIWRWTSNGAFTVASSYKALILAGKVRTRLMFIWRLKVPPTVKLFLFLLANDRLPTQEQLLKRNFDIPVGCKLCGSSITESSEHLFFKCDVTKEVFCRIGYPIRSFGCSLLDTLIHTFSSARGSNRGQFFIAASLYCIWLERNSRIFRGETRSFHRMVEWIISEVSLFSRCLL